MTVEELSAPCASSTPVKKTALAANDKLSTRDAGAIRSFDLSSNCNGAGLGCGLELDVFDSRGNQVEHDHNYVLMPIIMDTSVCVKEEEWDESLENLFATCDVDANFLAQSDSAFPAFLEEVINGDDDVPADDVLLPAFQCDVTPASPTPTVGVARPPAALRFKSSAGGAHTGAPCLFSCAGSTETRLSASCVSTTTTATASPLTCLVSPSGSLLSAVSASSPKGLSSSATTESPLCLSLLTSVDFSSTTESLFLSAPLAEVLSRATCPMSRPSSSAWSFSSCSSLSSSSSTTQRFLGGYSRARRPAEVDRRSEETAEGVGGLDDLLRELPASLQDGEDEDNPSGGRLLGNFPPTASSRPLERRARCREPRPSNAASRDPVLTSCSSHADDGRPPWPLTEEDDVCLPLVNSDAEAGLLRLLACDEDTLGHAIAKDDSSPGPAHLSSGLNGVVRDSVTRESHKNCGAGTTNDSPNCTPASTSLSRKRPRVEGDNSVLPLVIDCKKKCLDSSGFSDIAPPTAFSSCSKEEIEDLGDSSDGELSPQAQRLEKGGVELSSPKSRFLDFLSAFPESFDKNDKLRGGLLPLSPCLPMGRNV